MGVCRVLDLRLEERFSSGFGLAPDPRQVDEWICFVSINLDFLFYNDMHGFGCFTCFPILLFVLKNKGLASKRLNFCKHGFLMFIVEFLW